MRFLFPLLTIALLAGCATPSHEAAAAELPSTQTFTLDLGGGSLSRNFEVPEGASEVQVEVATAPGFSTVWAASVRAPSGSEAACDREIPAQGQQDGCLLSLGPETGTWTLHASSDEATRVQVTLSLR